VNSTGETEMARLTKGQAVEGVLFDKGTVVATGSANELRKYDASGALEEVAESKPCVAVETENGIAVYVAEEVWAV
jgi:hypothetical protein